MSYHNCGKNLRHWCYWCLLVLTGSPEKEGTVKKAVCSQWKQTERENRLCWFCSQASCKEIVWNAETETLAGGHRVLVSQPPLLPTRYKQSSKRRAPDMTWKRRKKRKRALMLFSSPLFSCSCLARAQHSKQSLGWGSVPGARCPLDQGQEPARVVTGQDRTAPALPLSWLPMLESCWNQGAERNVAWRQQIQNAEMGDRLMIVWRVAGFIAVLWEAGQKDISFRSGRWVAKI